MKVKTTTALVSAGIYFVTIGQSGAVGGAVETFRDMQNATSPPGKSGRIYVERAWRKEQGGDFSGAIADYTVAIAIEPKSADAHFYRALLYRALGRLKEAIADLDVVLKEEPRTVSAYLARGDAHADAGYSDAAIADYDNVLRWANNSAAGDVARAQVLSRKGDYVAAAARLEQARKRSPRDDYVLNAFAWFKATCPQPSARNGQKAVQAAIKACALTKWKDGDLVDTLAAAYAELGDFNQAIKYQMQALGIRPVSAPDSLANMQKHLRSYQAHRPFREEPKLRRARN